MDDVGGRPEPVDDETAGFGSWRHRARYRFDNLLARGTWATLLYLGAMTLSAILLSSVALTIAGVSFTGDEGAWLEDAWQSLLRVIDPGTMAGDVGWGQRLLALTVTLFGILVAGTLIGIIASGVEERIESMRRGRSVVIETGHVVVLGASDQLPLLVEHLMRARPDRDRATVVVLADDDPSRLDAQIRVTLPDRGGRLVIRSGDPTSHEDLALVRLSRAAGVVVLREDDGGDVDVAATVLAIGRVSRGAPRCPVVAELADPAVAARLVASCGTWVHPLATGVALGRTAVFALRQPGLGPVLSELLSPHGCQFQVVPVERSAATTFGDLIGHWTNARAIGLVGPDGSVTLNPPDERLIAPDEGVALISGDHALVVAAASMVRQPRDRRELGPPASRGRSPERMLVVGWSGFGKGLLDEWSRSAPGGSSVEVVLDVRDPVTVSPVVEGVPDLRVTRTSSLAQLIAERGGLGGVSTVLLVASDRLDPTEADVVTLLDLGVIQATRRSNDQDHPRVVVQVGDVDHAALVALDGRHDWLITPGLASQMLAQLVDQPARRAVLLSLYDRSSTSTLSLLPAEELGLVGSATVADIVGEARSRGLLAVGHLLDGPSRDRLVLAPALDATVTLTPGDQIVVVT